MGRTKKVDPHQRVNELDLLPYDTLISNRGAGGMDDPNLYMNRDGKGTKQKLSFGASPQDQYNAPPWLQADVKTMGEERKELEGRTHHGRGGKKADEYTRSGLTRDDAEREEFGGANIFARMRKRRAEKEATGTSFGQGRTRKHRERKLGLAGLIRH